MAQVRVSEGVLEGEVLLNGFGGMYCSFKGIPYAEPPIGDLRFKAPQPKKPWHGIRSAKDFGLVCPQYDHFAKDLKLGGEDCLYLNVYTPELKPKAPLPVMFWIHGGGFIWGSGNDDIYGPEFLVRQGVILVTFNYRLEVLGFLCLDTEDIPGNAGMKDQVAALRWVKQNISNFGGDPDNITIFGESAGAASVNYHLISPMTKGLFKRAIIQSGSVCWWSHISEPREKAIVLARKLGSNSENDKELYEFFKSQRAESFIASKLPITFNEVTKLYVNLHFAIVSEKKFDDQEVFFSGDVSEVLSNGIHEGVEVIAGYVEDESLILFGIINNLDAVIAQASNFLEFFVPKPIALTYPLSKQLEVGKKIKEFYFNKENISESNCEQLLKYISADILSYHAVRLHKIYAATNRNKLYFYKFSCKSKRNIFKHILKVENIVGSREVVSHCDDLAYLFPIKLMPQKIDQHSREFKMINQVTKLWTNFAKYGNPTPDDSLGAIWTPYTLDEQKYLDIGEELVLGSEPDKEEIDFWDSIYREYIPL